jgi:signal peptidase I
MKSNKQKRRSAAGKKNTAAVVLPIDNGIGRRPLIAAFVWLGFIGLSILFTGCPRMGALYAVYLVASLILIGAELAFLDAIWRHGKTNLFFAWKKFTGYALPFWYFAHSLPRITWRNADLISSGREGWIFALTLAATIAGCVAFFFAGRPAIQAALGVISPEEVTDRALRKKRALERKHRGLLAGILDWIDAIGWAVIAVILVQIFVFQLYEVPSESMVPTFLNGDRPFTLKLSSGPRVPLTEWRLPFLHLPQRGDVVTIANPRYPENHRVDIKKYVSQFVYMITFTTVHLDATLPDGTPKADPLVKRIVGLPGEKLMMVDDVLYARTAKGLEFRKIAEPWRAVDLWQESADLTRRIQHMPIDEKTRAILSKWDSKKNDADVAALAKEIAAMRSGIEESLRHITPAILEAFNEEELARADSGIRTRRDEAVDSASRGINPYATKGAGADDFSLALAALVSPDARAALEAYAQGAITAANRPAQDAYSKGARALNLIIKANLLGRIDRDLELIAQGSRIEAFGADPKRTGLLADARELYLYLQGFYDARNFPEFPSGTAYLARDEYFAMGDNRYNSLDFRFDDNQGLRALDPDDPVAVQYVSMLKPFPLKLQFIEGHAIFRVWPLSRMGRIK